MKSKEGIIWCWKMDIDNTLFIFREGGKEIEINLKEVNDYYFALNKQYLLNQEKEFLINLIEETNGK